MSDGRTTPKPGEWRWATVRRSKRRCILEFAFSSLAKQCYGWSHGSAYTTEDLTDISEPIVDPLVLKKNKKGSRP